MLCARAWALRARQEWGRIFRAKASASNISLAAIAFPNHPATVPGTSASSRAETLGSIQRALTTDAKIRSTSARLGARPNPPPTADVSKVEQILLKTWVKHAAYRSQLYSDVDSVLAKYMAQDPSKSTQTPGTSDLNVMDVSEEDEDARERGGGRKGLGSSRKYKGTPHPSEISRIMSIKPRSRRLFAIKDPTMGNNPVALHPEDVIPFLLRNKCQIPFDDTRVSDSEPVEQTSHAEFIMDDVLQTPTEGLIDAHSGEDQADAEKLEEQLLAEAREEILKFENENAPEEVHDRSVETGENVCVEDDADAALTADGAEEQELESSHPWTEFAIEHDPNLPTYLVDEVVTLQNEALNPTVTSEQDERIVENSRGYAGQYLSAGKAKLDEQIYASLGLITAGVGSEETDQAWEEAPIQRLEPAYTDVHNAARTQCGDRVTDQMIKSLCRLQQARLFAPPYPIEADREASNGETGYNARLLEGLSAPFCRSPTELTSIDAALGEEDGLSQEGFNLDLDADGNHNIVHARNARLLRERIQTLSQSQLPPSSTESTAGGDGTEYLAVRLPDLATAVAKLRTENRMVSTDPILPLKTAGFELVDRLKKREEASSLYHAAYRYICDQEAKMYQKLPPLTPLLPILAAPTRRTTPDAIQLSTFPLRQPSEDGEDYPYCSAIGFVAPMLGSRIGNVATVAKLKPEDPRRLEYELVKAQLHLRQYLDRVCDGKIAAQLVKMSVSEMSAMAPGNRSNEYDDEDDDGDDEPTTDASVLSDIKLMIDREILDEEQQIFVDHHHEPTALREIHNAPFNSQTSISVLSRERLLRHAVLGKPQMSKPKAAGGTESANQKQVGSEKSSTSLMMDSQKSPSNFAQSQVEALLANDLITEAEAISLHILHRLAVHDWEAVWELMDQAEQQQFPIEFYTYRELFTSFYKLGNAKALRIVFDHALAAPQYQHDIIRRNLVDYATLCQVILSMFKEVIDNPTQTVDYDLRELLKVFKYAKRKEKELRRTLLRSRFELGELARLYVMISTLLEEKAYIPKLRRSLYARRQVLPIVHLDGIIMDLLSKGLVQECFSLLDTQPHHAYSCWEYEVAIGEKGVANKVALSAKDFRARAPQSLLALLRAATASTPLEQLLTFLRRYFRHAPSSEAYEDTLSALVIGLASSGRLYEAVWCLEEHLQVIGKVDASENNETYFAVMSAPKLPSSPVLLRFDPSSVARALLLILAHYQEIELVHRVLHVLGRLRITIASSPLLYISLQRLLTGQFTSWRLVQSIFLPPAAEQYWAAIQLLTEASAPVHQVATNGGLRPSIGAAAQHLNAHLFEDGETVGQALGIISEVEAANVSNDMLTAVMLLEAAWLYHGYVPTTELIETMIRFITKSHGEACDFAITLLNRIRLCMQAAGVRLSPALIIALAQLYGKVGDYEGMKTLVLDVFLTQRLPPNDFFFALSTAFGYEGAQASQTRELGETLKSLALRQAFKEFCAVGGLKTLEEFRGATSLTPNSISVSDRRSPPKFSFPPLSASPDEPECVLFSGRFTDDIFDAEDIMDKRSNGDETGIPPTDPLARPEEIEKLFEFALYLESHALDKLVNWPLEEQHESVWRDVISLASFAGASLAAIFHGDIGRVGRHPMLLRLAEENDEIASKLDLKTLQKASLGDALTPAKISTRIHDPLPSATETYVVRRLSDREIERLINFQNKENYMPITPSRILRSYDFGFPISSRAQSALNEQSNTAMVESYDRVESHPGLLLSSALWIEVVLSGEDLGVEIATRFERVRSIIRRQVLLRRKAEVRLLQYAEMLRAPQTDLEESLAFSAFKQLYPLKLLSQSGGTPIPLRRRPPHMVSHVRQQGDLIKPNPDENGSKPPSTAYPLTKRRPDLLSTSILKRLGGTASFVAALRRNRTKGADNDGDSTMNGPPSEPLGALLKESMGHADQRQQRQSPDELQSGAKENIMSRLLRKRRVRRRFNGGRNDQGMRLTNESVENLSEVLSKELATELPAKFVKNAKSRTDAESTTASTERERRSQRNGNGEAPLGFSFATVAVSTKSQPPEFPPPLVSEISRRRFCTRVSTSGSLRNASHLKLVRSFTTLRSPTTSNLENSYVTSKHTPPASLLRRETLSLSSYSSSSSASSSSSHSSIITTNLATERELLEKAIALKDMTIRAAARAVITHSIASQLAVRRRHCSDEPLEDGDSFWKDLFALHQKPGVSSHVMDAQFTEAQTHEDGACMAESKRTRESLIEQMSRLASKLASDAQEEAQPHIIPTSFNFSPTRILSRSVSALAVQRAILARITHVRLESLRVASRQMKAARKAPFVLSSLSVIGRRTALGHARRKALFARESIIRSRQVILDSLLPTKQLIKSQLDELEGEIKIRPEDVMLEAERLRAEAKNLDPALGETISELVKPSKDLGEMVQRVNEELTHESTIAASIIDVSVTSTKREGGLSTSRRISASPPTQEEFADIPQLLDSVIEHPLRKPKLKRSKKQKNGATSTLIAPSEHRTGLTDASSSPLGPEHFNPLLAATITYLDDAVTRAQAELSLSRSKALRRRDTDVSEAGTQLEAKEVPKLVEPSPLASRLFSETKLVSNPKWEERALEVLRSREAFLMETIRAPVGQSTLDALAEAIQSRRSLSANKGDSEVVKNSSIARFRNRSQTMSTAPSRKIYANADADHLFGDGSRIEKSFASSKSRSNLTKLASSQTAPGRGHPKPSSASLSASDSTKGNANPVWTPMRQARRKVSEKVDQGDLSMIPTLEVLEVDPSLTEPSPLQEFSEIQMETDSHNMDQQAEPGHLTMAPVAHSGTTPQAQAVSVNLKSPTPENHTSSSETPSMSTEIPRSDYIPRVRRKYAL